VVLTDLSIYYGLLSGDTSSNNPTIYVLNLKGQIFSQVKSELEQTTKSIKAEDIFIFICSLFKDDFQ
jgi:hypothetical protein